VIHFSLFRSLSTKRSDLSQKNKMGRRGLKSSRSGLRHLAGSFEHVNELSGFIKFGKYFD
jgi:hypothetical protein